MRGEIAAEAPTGRPRRPTAYGLTGLVAVLWVLGGVLLRSSATSPTSPFRPVRRQPSNAVGWLFFLIAGALALGTVMPEYGIYALRVSPGALPAPDLVLALAQPTPAIALIGIVLVLQLFPNGRPVSPRWGVIVRVTVAALVLGTIAQWVVPHRIVDVWSDDLDHAHVSALDPNVAAPEQSIKDFVENPTEGQSIVECTGPLPCGPLKTIRSPSFLKRPEGIAVPGLICCGSSSQR